MKTTNKEWKPIVISTKTARDFFEEENGSDLVVLYTFYLMQSNFQKTNSVYATNLFVMKKLRMGHKKFLLAKKKLVGMGLIQEKTLYNKRSSKIKWYILLPFNVRTKTVKALLDNPDATSGDDTDSAQVSLHGSIASNCIKLDTKSAQKKLVSSSTHSYSVLGIHAYTELSKLDSKVDSPDFSEKIGSPQENSKAQHVEGGNPDNPSELPVEGTPSPPNSANPPLPQLSESELPPEMVVPAYFSDKTRERTGSFRSWRPDELRRILETIKEKTFTNYGWQLIIDAYFQTDYGPDVDRNIFHFLDPAILFELNRIHGGRNAGNLNSDVEENILKFIDLYEANINADYPRFASKNFEKATEQMQHAMSIYGTSLSEMMELYFEQPFDDIDCNYHIFHFLTDGVLSILAEKCR